MTTARAEQTAVDKPQPPKPPAQESGPFGTGTYFSSPEEETTLRSVGKLADSVEAIGHFRSKQYEIVVRLPNGVIFDKSLLPISIEPFSLVYKQSQFTQLTLKSTEDAIETTQRRLDDSTYTMFYNPRIDQIHIAGQLSSGLRRFLGTLGNLVDYSDETQLAGLASRFYDSEPFYGGSAINVGPYPRCSSALAVRGNTDTFLMTAHHCTDSNSTGELVITTGNSDTVGRIARLSSYPARDIALIAYRNYGGYIFMGNRTGTAYPVSSARDATVGSVLCSSGTTTLQSCGKEVYCVSCGSFDRPGGTTKYLTVTVGNVVRGGDSGGPLVNLGDSSVGFRGIVIAYGDQDNSFFQRWSSIVDEYPGLSPV